MTAPRDSTCVTVTVLIDDDLSRSGTLPALLSTDDTGLYPNTHPKYTRVAARYQANAAAQSIVVVADRAVGLSRAQGCVSSSAVRAPCIPVDVVVLFEPAQITSAFQLADTGTTSSRAPMSASACTPASRYLDAYLTSVVQAAAEDVRNVLTPALTDHHYSDRHAAMTDGLASSITGLTMSPAHPPMDITIHLLVCPNCTEASAGTNITNANLSAKDAALFAAAAHSVARRWHSVGSTPPSPGEANRGHEWRICRQHIGFCATLASCRRATSFVLALAGKRLKALREDAARAAHTWTIGGLTKTIPVAKRAESRCGLPHQTSLWVSALTPNMIRPDAPRKCEPNDFVKLYQTMLGEIVSVSDRRAMAALAAFPTMHHLLAHVDHVYSTDAECTQEEGVPSTSASRAPTTAAVYAQNFGEDRRYNVVNEAIVDALCTDYRKAEEDETT